jgi:[protein-PII] uridylyltransferase
MTHPSQDPFYKRTRLHATKRIRFLPDVPAKDRVKGYKQFLRMEREIIVRHHRKGASGLVVCQEGSLLTDVIIESIFRTALLTFSEKHGTLPCKCSLVALGGYGRGELNPLSDIDLMFLFPDSVKPGVVADMKSVLTDEVLYPLWDLGFKVGHCTRTIKECIEEAKSDYKTRNSLLESRLILGSAEIHRELKKQYRDWINRSDLKAFLVEMITMQEKRRSQYGGSVFVPEPNIKNGVGGLRDRQGVGWMVLLLTGKPAFDPFYAHVNLITQEMQDLQAAYAFMLRIRNELHLNSKRATDELTLGLQPMIAENLGYTGHPLERVERFMKDYYSHARNQLRIARSLERRMLARTESLLQTQKSKFRWVRPKKTQRTELEGFVLEGDTLYPGNQDLFEQDPASILMVFRLIQQRSLKLSVELERLIEAKAHLLTKAVSCQPRTTDLFRQIIECEGRVFDAVESMYDLGILVKMIPEFESLSCLIQHDLHLVRYSEDQKVINSLQFLDALLTGGHQHTRELLPTIDSRESITDLYWSLLLFALKYPGQIRRNVPKKERKATNVERILKRLGLERGAKTRILTFIDSHREMAHFWHKADSDDNLLIRKLSFSLTDHESAKKSFWFHYCDGLARNPQYWDVHSLASTSKVYQALVEHINQGNPDHAPEVQAIDSTTMTRIEIDKKPLPDVSHDEVDAHFHLLPERYFASRNAEDVQLHIRLVHKLLESIQKADSLGSLKPVIDWRDGDDGQHSVINVVTWDRQGLFYKLAGAISAAGLNILRARAISRSDHIAIDTFYVQLAKTGSVGNERVKEQFEQSIEAILVEGAKAYPRVKEQFELSNRNRLTHRGSDFERTLPVQVEINFEAELNQIVVDYQGKDRIGLLYQISRTVSMEGFNIDSVRISTNGDVASGTLFLSTENTEHTAQGDLLPRIRESLIDILSSESWMQQ